MVTKNVLISISFFTNLFACFLSFFGPVLGHVWHTGGAISTPKTPSQKIRARGADRGRFLVVLGWLLEATGVLFGTVFDHNYRKNQCQRILSKKRLKVQFLVVLAYFAYVFVERLWYVARGVWCVVCGVLCVACGV